MTDHTELRNRLFAELLQQAQGKECLQISVRERKYGPSWVSADLFDRSREIDFYYDVQAMGFPDESFDIVVCNAVLEHVPDPLAAISELHRVLRPTGRIWVEAPFNQPYHRAPEDYWRVSPSGMRIWMQRFEEQACGVFKINRSSIYNAVFFTGRKT